MPDLDVHPDAIRAADSGEPIITRETADQETARWTDQHPPAPGLRWRISWGVNADGQPEVRERRLEVIPGWEDAYAPSVDTHPVTAARRAVQTRADEANRLGSLAYQGWFSALPKLVRESSSKAWADLPEPFREPLRQAAVLVWQVGENAGFHEALLRTLPSGRLGAAGELENIRDLITAVAITNAKPLPGRNVTPPELITVNLNWLREQITERVGELRRLAAAEAKRERDAGRRR